MNGNVRWHYQRDYRSVEKNHATVFRMPLGMRPFILWMHSSGMLRGGLFAFFYRAMHSDGMRKFIIIRWRGFANRAFSI